MYKHIKRDDRVCIALMLKQDYTHTEISKELGFHRTTISREIERNSDENGMYRVWIANKKAKENRKIKMVAVPISSCIYIVFSCAHLVNECNMYVNLVRAKNVKIFTTKKPFH